MIKLKRKEITPGELLSVGVGAIAIAVSVWTFWRQQDTTDEQAAFERDVVEAQAAFQTEIEERQSAPLLVPGVELRDRGKRITVFTESGVVKKRADRLLIGGRPARLIIPMRNVGEGVAILLRERVKTIPDCADAEHYTAIPPRGLERLGYYVVRPGESEQLAYLAPNSRVAAEYRGARNANSLNLLVRYTDALGRKLRWTCVRYSQGKGQRGWSVAAALYGERRPPTSAALPASTP
jgi:hypothetical protein